MCPPCSIFLSQTLGQTSAHCCTGRQLARLHCIGLDAQLECFCHTLRTWWPPIEVPLSSRLHYRLAAFRTGEHRFRLSVEALLKADRWNEFLPWVDAIHLSLVLLCSIRLGPSRRGPQVSSPQLKTMLSLATSTVSTALRRS